MTLERIGLLAVAAAEAADAFAAQGCDRAYWCNREELLDSELCAGCRERTRLYKEKVAARTRVTAAVWRYRRKAKAAEEAVAP